MMKRIQNRRMVEHVYGIDPRYSYVEIGTVNETKGFWSKNNKQITYTEYRAMTLLNHKRRGSSR